MKPQNKKRSKTQLIRLILASVAPLLTAAIAVWGFVEGDVYQAVLATLSTLFLFTCFWLSMRLRPRQQAEMERLIEEKTLEAATTSREAVLQLSLPTVCVDLNGAIEWYNKRFSDLLGGSGIKGRLVTEISEELEVSRMIENKSNISIKISFADRFYLVLGNVVKVLRDGADDYTIVLFFLDVTAYEDIVTRYRAERLCVSNLMLDNYDEAFSKVPDAERGHYVAQVDRHVAEWAASAHGIFRKLERDRYLFLFEQENLTRFEEEKFGLLESIKEILPDKSTPLTMSIGVGADGEHFIDSAASAKSALDMALGRGGDQAVVKRGDAFEFFGGKSMAVEKASRVKARVIAYALRELVRGADQVYLMGHKNGDLDSVGASIGLFSALSGDSIPCHIVLDEVHDTVNRLLDRFAENPKYHNVFLSSDTAIEQMTPNTLVILLDTHRASYAECAQLVENSKHVVIIDHHRKSADFVQNAVLVYHEPYASSACEMITEMLAYLDPNRTLEKMEAEALYAGIAMDTKNFTFQTGVRTFETASVLRKAGVDTIGVKKLFQNDLYTYVKKSQVIGSSVIYRKHIAIATCDDQLYDAQILSAQVADEMLSVTDITASFVLTRAENLVMISARSLGEINVQLIMEKLGGGGHLNVAGAQLKDCTEAEAIEQLKAAIDSVLDQ